MKLQSGMVRLALIDAFQKDTVKTLPAGYLTRDNLWEPGPCTIPDIAEGRSQWTPLHEGVWWNRLHQLDRALLTRENMAVEDSREVIPSRSPLSIGA